MPKGPKGEKRPADGIGAAVMVARIATGELEEKGDTADDGKDQAAVALGCRSGRRGRRNSARSAGRRSRREQLRRDGVARHLTRLTMSIFASTIEA
jgi:hypothetical protein